ncbi:hypothetical protein [Parabacteroides sp. HGS0025]|jgi:hypothetical protein|uniref:hypothetical protein n=1 Tax=Parabacteroides sp. HGS0025 TaxID=1078087 RepID=UPI0006174EF9|nr:hypothetical protein [Parabacteroides sp. HGS0025]KKB45104.1 hypothetical protein HMPREF1212_05272 [Parabacteroides sp. HGS0025]
MQKKKVLSYIADQKRAFKARRALQLKFFLCLMLLFASVSTISAITSPDDAKVSTEIVVGTTMASMMAIGSIDDVADKEVAGESIAYKVWLIETKQLDGSRSFPIPNASREVSSLPMLDGEYMHYFEAHDIPTYTSSGEKGDLTISSTNTLTIIMGGVRDQLLKFIEEKAGCKFLIIFQECESNNRFILGNPCKPMVLKSFNLKNDKENRSVTFTFENKSIKQYHKYVGDIIVKDAVTITAGATALATQPGVNTYKIPNGSSATYALATVSGLTASDKGRTITLVGTGSDKAATVADNTSFVLEDGATWTAKAGSQISFRVLDSTTLVEIQGSRVQTA